MTQYQRKEASQMVKNRFSYSKLSAAFDADHVNFWSNLSRLNNLMVIMNISMFFLTGLVATQVIRQVRHLGGYDQNSPCFLVLHADAYPVSRPKLPDTVVALAGKHRPDCAPDGAKGRCRAHRKTCDLNP